MLMISLKKLTRSSRHGYLNVRVLLCIKKEIHQTSAFCVIVLRLMHYNCHELVCSDWNKKEEYEWSWVHRFHFVISFPGVSLYARQWPMMDQASTNIMHFYPISSNLLRAHFFADCCGLERYCVRSKQKLASHENMERYDYPTGFATLNI